MGAAGKTKSKTLPVPYEYYSMPQDQECRQCGRCCEKWGWDQPGIPEDLVPWIAHHRTDILGHVSITFRDGKRSDGRDLSPGDLTRIARIYYWVDPGGADARPARSSSGQKTAGRTAGSMRPSRQSVPVSLHGTKEYAIMP